MSEEHNALLDRLGKELYIDMCKTIKEVTSLDLDLIFRISSGIEANWSSKDLVGFITIMHSVSSQAEKNMKMILYGALTPVTLTTLVMGLSARDMAKIDKIDEERARDE